MNEEAWALRGARSHSTGRTNKIITYSLTEAGTWNQFQVHSTARVVIKALDLLMLRQGRIFLRHKKH